MLAIEDRVQAQRPRSILLVRIRGVGGGIHVVLAVDLGVHLGLGGCIGAVGVLGRRAEGGIRILVARLYRLVSPVRVGQRLAGIGIGRRSTRRLSMSASTQRESTAAASAPSSP